MIDRNVYQLNPLVMWLLVCLSIGIVTCDSLIANDEFGSHLETNKINKGIWLRHRHRTDDRQNSGHFFRSNSNENEPFANALSVINRDKRSIPSKTRKRDIKNVKGLSKEQDSKISLLNNFPLSVAMILENSNNKHIDYNGYPKYETKAPLYNETNELTQAINKEYEKGTLNDDDNLNYFKDILNVTETNATAKRSMKYDELIVDRIDLLDIYNKTKDINKKPNTNGDQMWQTAPIPDNNLYEILPKDPNAEPENPKPVTEKGLIKVLSMLTRTFKKIMKQQHSVKVIHEQMTNVNKEFGEKIELNTKRLKEFDVKYTTIMKLMEKLSHFQDCLKKKEENYKKKEETMSKNMLDFESQQNKFLAQQQQFYNIQKLMLVQNEKINEKQNTIAKMQSEIAHRQNHFAKILKKAKQNVQNNKNLRLNSNLSIKTNSVNTHTTKIEPKATTEQTTSIDPVKINLLSLAPNNIIENQDQMILREKDDKSVDDLIYKYYFNNTFIDTVIRNKILGGVAIGDKTSIARSAKLAAKRNQEKFAKNATKLKTTLLFPVTVKSLNRHRRWINHHSTRKHRKRHPSKGHPDTQSPKQSIFKLTTSEPTIVKQSDVTAKDPFLAMATNFCTEIGQSNTKQILDWCVEKALRRLKSLDRKMMPPAALLQTSPEPKKAEKPSTTLIVKTTPLATVSVHPTITTPPALFLRDKTQNSETKTGLYDNQFFPDNQELESNLKEFVSMYMYSIKHLNFYNETEGFTLKQYLTPDTAGNVYYDGSLHASDILPHKSEGLSDILPGFDSNSKIDIDPKLITLQLRRKYMRQTLPQNLWKH